MEARGLSRKYAQAVFSLALENWLKALNLVNDKLAENSNLVEKLQDSKLAFEERQKILNNLLPPDTAQPIKNFLYTLLKEGDINMLNDVVAELDRMTRGGPKVQIAQVTTALPLSDADKDDFRSKLRQKYGDTLEFTFSVDSSLIGGAIVQVGDKIIDGSVATRLESMSNLLGVKK